MHNDLITVIIPIYNVEPYLRECLDSVLAQSHTNLQIVLVNDGSPDNCPAICDEYAERDGRIQVIHKENGGVSSARNAGLDVAKGKYIGFVDPDDYIHPSMYEELLAAIKEYDADFVQCGGALHLKKLFLCNQKEAFRHFSIKDGSVSYSVCDKLFRASTIITNNLRFDTRIAHAEDALFVANYMKHITLLICIPKDLYVVRERYGSAIRSVNLSRAYSFRTASDEMMMICEEYLPGSSEYYYGKANSRLVLIEAFYHEKLHKSKECRDLISLTRRYARSLFCQSEIAFLVRVKLLIKAYLPSLYVWVRERKRRRFELPDR